MIIKPAIKTRRGGRRPVSCLTTDQEIYDFDSITIAAQQMEVNRQCLQLTLNGRYNLQREYPKGYFWWYQDDPDELRPVVRKSILGV